MVLDIIVKFRVVFELLYRIIYLRGHRHIRRQLLLSKYISRHLDWAEIQADHTFANPNVRKDKTIWILWTQGIENAPELVKKCYHSLLKYKGDYDVIVLTNKNIDNYVRLPHYVEELYKKKDMSEALHSDMVRLYLMINYGGIWRDATCYQSAPYPKYINISNFFMFSSDLLHYSSPIVCSSWFIRSDNNNPLIIKTYNFLCEYLRRYKTPHDYYIFHLVLSVLVKEDDECKRIWGHMPYVCNMNPHVLFFNWGREYTDSEYYHLLSSCFIHKLSYKFVPQTSNTNCETIYSYLMEGNV